MFGPRRGVVGALGMVNGTIAFAAMFAGVAGLSTGTDAVLASVQPLLILLPAWWLYGEAIRARDHRGASSASPGWSWSPSPAAAEPARGCRSCPRPR